LLWHSSGLNSVVSHPWNSRNVSQPKKYPFLYSRAIRAELWRQVFLSDRVEGVKGSVEKGKEPCRVRLGGKVPRRIGRGGK